jgi:hypothetical protein
MSSKFVKKIFYHPAALKRFILKKMDSPCLGRGLFILNELRLCKSSERLKLHVHPSPIKLLVLIISRKQDLIRQSEKETVLIV